MVGTGINQIAEGDTLGGSLDIVGGGLRVGGSLVSAGQFQKALAAKSAKLEPYSGPGGGHHVPAKSAFPGASGYD
jgi:hypothetical protein